MLGKGDNAPEFKLPNEDGDEVALSDFTGRRVVIYFYPKDDTPGCTTEACQFNERLGEFSDADVEVIGISPDAADSHQIFRAKYGLNIQLLSDVNHGVMEAYGAWGEKVRDGKTTMGVIRSTFLVDRDGHVEIAEYNVTPDGHAADILSHLG